MNVGGDVHAAHPKWWQAAPVSTTADILQRSMVNSEKWRSWRAPGAKRPARNEIETIGQPCPDDPASSESRHRSQRRYDIERECCPVMMRLVRMATTVQATATRPGGDQEDAQRDRNVERRVIAGRRREIIQGPVALRELAIFILVCAVERHTIGRCLL